jgi:hypothetical protein
MSDIFVSYVEEDSRIADQIGQGLRAAGYSTWLYEQDGLPGTDYMETIGKVIDQAQAIVILISAKSVQSTQVYRELVRAAENEKALFPLLHGITHEQFQERVPNWRQALGATTSIGIPPQGVAAIMPRLLAGLEAMGIRPSGPAGTAPPPPAPQRRAIPIWAYALLGVVAVVAAVAITLAVTRQGAAPSASPTAVSQEPTQPAAATETLAAAATAAPSAQPISPADTATAEPVPPTSVPTAQPSLPPATPSAEPPTPTAVPALDLQAVPLQVLEIDQARQIAWSPDGKWMAIRASDLHFLNGGTYEVAYSLTSIQWPADMAFSPDGSALAYADDDLVSFLQVGTWGDLGTLAVRGRTESLAYSPDGQMLATAIGEVVKLWDLSTGQEVRVLPGTSGYGVAISPDGQMLAAPGGVAGTEIKRWDLATGEELPALTGHTNWIKTLEFSPDGRILASGCVDQSVRLWDVAAGRLLAVLTGHTGEVTDVAFSPDGRLLASASWDLSVKLWDVARAVELESLLGHTGWVECVCFSPDGGVLASGSGDGVRLWSIEVSGGATEASP